MNLTAFTKFSPFLGLARKCLVLAAALAMAASTASAERRIYSATAAFAEDINTLVEWQGNSLLEYVSDDIARSSLVTAGESIYLLEGDAKLPKDRISQYSLDGEFLQILAELDFGAYFRIESDHSGNIYVNGARSLRIDSSGNVTEIGDLEGSFGIDADAAGNVYTARVDPGGGIIQKADSNGVELASWQAPFVFVGDIAVDEIGERLFVANQPGGMAVYDISTDVPTLIDDVAIPFETNGIAFDDLTGNVLVASLQAQLLEVTPTGEIVDSFFDPRFFTDVTSIVVPEPSSLTLLFAGALLFYRRATKAKLRE